MNSLSWLIYMADVANGAHHNLGILMGITIVGAIALAIGGGIVGDVDYSYYDDAGKLKSKMRRIKFWDWSKRLAFIVVPSILIIGTILPSSKTIMMIAASEFGEEIAVSAGAKNLGGKSYKALDKFLSDYLEEKQ